MLQEEGIFLASLSTFCNQLSAQTSQQSFNEPIPSCTRLQFELLSTNKYSEKFQFS